MCICQIKRICRNNFFNRKHFSHDTYVKESLNNGKGNNGIYNANQLTDSGQTQSEDLMVYKIGPGQAYVKGYEVETIAPSHLDVPKPRNTNLLDYSILLENEFKGVAVLGEISNLARPSSGHIYFTLNINYFVRCIEIKMIFLLNSYVIYL